MIPAPIRTPTVADIAAIMECDIAPPTLAEEGDAIGLQVGDEAALTPIILATLDLTREVANEALRHRATLIVSHHPVIYRPLHRLSPTEPPGDVLSLLIRHNVAAFVAHTNLDAAPGGVNDCLATLLDLHRLQPLHSSTLDPEAGMGRLGTLVPPLSPRALITRIQKRLHVENISTVGNPPPRIGRLAVCSGSGKSLLSLAARAGADAYLTGDLTHHAALEARARGLFILDAGHYATEHVVVTPLARRLAQVLADRGFRADVIVSQHITDPFNPR